MAGPRGPAPRGVNAGTARAPARPMELEELLARLVRAGFSDDAAARRALEAVLGALAASGAGTELALLAPALPPELRPERVPPSRGPFDADAFYAAVAAREDLGPGPGLEHAQIVCRELGLLLEPDVRVRLARALSRELFDAPRYTPPAAPVRRASVPPEHTLATGRPGSAHPLSEAAPPGAQSHSVAETNPHEDGKLSSARGLTQEALREDLAEGRPRGKPISEG